MKTFTFEFLNGWRVSYQAESLSDAMDMRYKQFGNMDWTIVYPKS